MRRSIMGLLAAVAAWAGGAVAGEQRLPAEFVDNRIYVVPKLPDGTPLRFYTDSGGGFNALRADVVQRLQLPVQGDGDDRSVAFPRFRADAAIEAPVVADDPLHHRLVVVDGRWLDDDGFLGNRWFGGRIWLFDYSRQRLALLHGWTPPAEAAHTPLTWRGGPHGYYWARIVVRIDGESIPLLFDTGAQFTLAADAAAAFDRPLGARVAGSFITRSHFERWQRAHPDWRVLTAGDHPGKEAIPIIEVPAVEIAGVTVGPVWFAMRADADFGPSFMSSMTDAPVEGAMGGSALRYLRIVADYPGRTLYVWPGGAR